MSPLLPSLLPLHLYTRPNQSRPSNSVADGRFVGSYFKGHLSLRRKSLHRFAGKNRRYPPDKVLRIGITQRSPHSVGAVEAHQTACLRKLLAQVEGSGRPVLVSRAVARLPCLLSTFTLYTLLALEKMESMSAR